MYFLTTITAAVLPTMHTIDLVGDLFLGILLNKMFSSHDI